MRCAEQLLAGGHRHRPRPEVVPRLGRRSTVSPSRATSIGPVKSSGRGEGLVEETTTWYSRRCSSATSRSVERGWRFGLRPVGDQGDPLGRRPAPGRRAPRRSPGRRPDDPRQLAGGAPFSGHPPTTPSASTRRPPAELAQGGPRAVELPLELLSGARRGPHCSGWSAASSARSSRTSSFARARRCGCSPRRGTHRARGGRRVARRQQLGEHARRRARVVEELCVPDLLGEGCEPGLLVEHDDRVVDVHPVELAGPDPDRRHRAGGSR